MSYVLALTLFPKLSYAAVWRRLTATLCLLRLPGVSEAALRHLRRRLTPAPFQLLFKAVAVPLAPPSAPGVSYRNWRTVAFDGRSSIKPPDSDRARAGSARSATGSRGWDTRP